MQKIIDDYFLDSIHNESYLMLSKHLCRRLGINQAILFCHLAERHTLLLQNNTLAQDGFFQLQQKEIEETIGLSIFQQRLSLQNLIELKLVEVERKGVPPVNKYRLNSEIISQISKDILKNKETSFLKNKNTSFNPINNNNIIINNIKDSFKGKERKEGKERIGSLLLNSKRIKEDPRRNVPNFSKEIETLIYPKNIPDKIKSLLKPVHHRQIFAIISYWNEKPGLRKIQFPKEGQKSSLTFLSAIKYIRMAFTGKLPYLLGLGLKPYFIDQIKEAIDNFWISATDVSYLPMNKANIKKIGIDNFFYSKYMKRSLFLYWVISKPKPVRNFVKPESNPYPRLTEGLKRSYFEKILDSQSRELSLPEEYKLSKAGILLQKTIENLQTKVRVPLNINEWCDYVVDCLMSTFGKENIVIGNLSSEWTYSEVLPRFLEKKGIIEKN